MASPGVWTPDPLTGKFGIAKGTAPGLPVDTTSDTAKALATPEYQQVQNAGGAQTSAPAASGSSASSLPAPSTDPISFIRQYQLDHAASPQAVQDLFAQLQQQYGIGRYNDATYGPSNNEVSINGQKTKVYSEGGNSWYDPAGLSSDGGGSSAGGGASTGYGIPASVPQSSSPYDPALQAAIQGLLSTPQTVNAEDVINSPENDAFRLSAQRAQERGQAQLAEQASFDGTSDSGGEDVAKQGLRQQRGDSESAFVGNLAVTKMQDNRDRLLAGIQAATQAKQFDQAEALQVELANLDAAIRRETLTQQGNQFNDQLGYNYTALNETANEAATRALLGI